jgi:hypothetical protein
MIDFVMFLVFTEKCMQICMQMLWPIDSRTSATKSSIFSNERNRQSLP